LKIQPIHNTSISIKTPFLRWMFLLLILISNFSIAQYQDAQVQKLTKQFDTTYYKNLEKGDSIIKKAVLLARKSKSTIDIGNSLYRQGIVFDIKGESDSAIYYLLSGIDYLKKTDDWQSLSNAYNNLGVCYFNIYDYEKMIEVGLLEVALYEANNSLAEKAFALNNMSLAFNYLQRYDEALEAQMEALGLFEQLGDTSGIEGALVNIGNSYYNRGKLEIAYDYYKRAEKLLPSIQNNLARITFHNGMANIYRAMNMLDKSIAQLNIALEIAKTYNAPERIQYLYETLSELSEQKGDFEAALNYYKKFKEIRDQIYTDERNLALAEFERKFELLEMREIQQESEQKIEQQNRTILLATLGLVVLLIIVVLTLYAFRLKQKASYLAQKRLEEKTLMVREMHHRVKNNLQLVSSMINIQSRGMDETNQAKMMQLDNNIQSMATIHESLYSSYDWEWIALKGFCEKLESQLRNSSVKPVDVNINSVNLEIDLDTAISIGLIINELFLNSQKHGFEDNGKVGISINLNENDMILTYRDNGKGLPEGYNFDGGNFGTKMIRTMLRKLKATAEIESNMGAIFTFKIKRFKLKSQA
jgi:two-component system, sensor histidine kinase PdtaS